LLALHVFSYDTADPTPRLLRPGRGVCHRRLREHLREPAARGGQPRSDSPVCQQRHRSNQRTRLLFIYTFSTVQHQISQRIF